MHLDVTQSGEMVGGSRYRTLGQLGSGGMADLYLALQQGVAGSSRLCVLKRIRKDLAGRADYASMFLEEARISASLNHPNIVQVYEVGGQERDCFLVMEFLRGRSYAHVQRAAGNEPLDYLVALEVLLGTLAGLAHTHQRRDLAGQPMELVHRDISPPNVMITYEGEIKVLDFGVAKAKDSLVQTAAGILKGKVAYMAPEVIAQKPYDARADLYAVGVMLWEATAGRDRWPGMNEMAILAQLARRQTVELPGATPRGLPALADRICARALAPDPAQRHQTAEQLRADLLALCDALGGRVGQHVIKDYMALRFAAERRREAREIDAALQRAQRPSRSAAAVEEIDRHGASTKRMPRKQPVEPAALAPSRPPPPAPAPSRARPLALTAVLLLLGVGLAALLLPAERAGSGVAEKQPPSAPSPAPVAPQVAIASPAPAAEGAADVPQQASIAPAAASAAPAEAASSSKPAVRRRQGGAPNLVLDRRDPWQD